MDDDEVVPLSYKHLIPVLDIFVRAIYIYRKNISWGRVGGGGVECLMSVVCSIGKIFIMCY